MKVHAFFYFWSFVFYFFWVQVFLMCKCVSIQGVPCDLVTGEERTFVDVEGRAAEHVACTIEMCSVNTPCEFSCDLVKLKHFLEHMFV